MLFAVRAISSYRYAETGHWAHGNQEKNDTPGSTLRFLLILLLRIPLPPLNQQINLPQHRNPCPHSRSKDPRLCAPPFP